MRMDLWNFIFGIVATLCGALMAYGFFKGKTEERLRSIESEIQELKSQRKEDMIEIKKDIKDIFKLLNQIQVKIGQSFNS